MLCQNTHDIHKFISIYIAKQYYHEPFFSCFQEVQHLFFQILQFILKQHKELPQGQVCRDVYMFYNTIYDISIFFFLLTHNCSFVHLEFSTHCQDTPDSLPVSVTLIMKGCLRKSLMILCFLS